MTSARPFSIPGPRQRHTPRSHALLPTVLLLLFAVVVAPQAIAASRTLQKLKIEPLPGDAARLILTLSAPPPKPRVFSVEDPPSISIDLPDTENGLKKRFRNINAGNARTVAAVQADGRTRVVLQLDHSAPYAVDTRGNRVYVTVGSKSSGQVHPNMQSSSVFGASRSSTTTGGPSRVTDVDFHRGQDGAARVIVHLSRPNTNVNVKQRDGNVVLDFRNTNLPQRLIRRMNVIDFSTPAQYIDTRRIGNDVKMTVIPVKGADYKRVAYQTGNTFTLELQPKKSQQTAQNANGEGQQPHYTGKRISLNFQDIKIRALLQIIADVANVNMVVSDSVHGSMALRLDNVPWDQALDIILQTQGLGKTRKGNVIMVAPLKELAARREAELNAEKQQQKLAPLQSTVIQINYAKAKDIAALLKSPQNSLLSDRGKVSVDERTNTLLLQDTPDRITQIRKLINRLDRPVRQVLIQSRVVIATSNYAKDLGTQFGVTVSNGHVSTSGSAAAADSAVQNSVTSPSLANRFNVTLPASPSEGTAGKLAFAILGSNYLVDLELSALQAEGRGEVISSPHVITANGKEATIEQGTEIPYQEASSSGATSVSFKKAVLSLNVTPQITPDGRIVMDLVITKDAVGKQVSDSQGGTVPAIDTRKVSTQVMVNNGDTVVLGGIYENDRHNSESKIPLLGDIPLLGALFRKRHVDTSRTELLVFVTPKILTQSMQIQ